MSTKLKTRSKPIPEDLRRSSRHCHLEDCCRKQKDTRIRKKEHLSKKAKLSLTKVVDKNIIEVIKSLSGSSSNSKENYSNNIEDTKISRSESESSIIYVGTSYPKSEMPRNESIIDLTKSDTTILSKCSYNLDNYDISGDNIIDELHLKDHVSSAASIYTILPPQPPSLFSSPSDELCVCRTDNPCCVLSFKRNRSASDVSTLSNNQRSKRVASSRSRLSEKISSSDCVWKLKKSYPLHNGLCGSKHETEDNAEDMNVDVNYNFNILEIVADLEKEFDNISGLQHSALASELNALKVASMLDDNLSTVSNLSNVSNVSNV